MVLLEVPKEFRGGTYMTIDELAPHGDEPVEFLVNDELLYHAGLEPRPETNDDDQMDQDDDPIEGKKDKSSGLDIGALERDFFGISIQ